MPMLGTCAYNGHNFYMLRDAERVADGVIDAIPCHNWPKTQNARLPIARRRALTGLSFLCVEKKRAPRKEPSSYSARDNLRFNSPAVFYMLGQSRVPLSVLSPSCHR